MMRRRSFLGALLGAALPLPPLPLKPTIMGVDFGIGDAVAATWVHIDDYIVFMHPEVVKNFVMQGHIGRYEGVRFVESKEIRRV